MIMTKKPMIKKQTQKETIENVGKLGMLMLKNPKLFGPGAYERFRKSVRRLRLTREISENYPGLKKVLKTD